MYFDFLILPALIFLARICDVTIGTLRIIFIARGNKVIAPILGFFEVLIWIIAISRIMHNLDNWICYIAYAGGFATGNFIGLRVEEKLAMGVRGFRIVTGDQSNKLIDELQRAGFGLTFMQAEGTTGKVIMIYTVVQRQNLDLVKKLVARIDPDAFYIIEDIRTVKNGVFKTNETQNNIDKSDFRYWRRGV